MKGMGDAVLVRGALVLCLLASAGAYADNCHPSIDPTQPQYIIGYGSLMERASKRRTAPETGPNLPIELTGYERSWNTPGSETGFSTTFLGVQPKDGARMVATIYRDYSQDEILKTDTREDDYCRHGVEGGSIRMLDGTTAPANGQFWIYVIKSGKARPPSADLPIVQSYVDIFLSGCLQLRKMVTDGQQDFAEQCIETTKGWSTHWVNDRLYPRRPFIYQPNAATIDKLLRNHLPKEFGSIRIE